MLVSHIVVDIKETEVGLTIRGVAPELEGFPVGRVYQDMQALDVDVVANYLRPRGIRGVVSYEIWPPAPTAPRIDIRLVRQLVGDPELKLLTDDELEQELRKKQKLWAERLAAWRAE